MKRAIMLMFDSLNRHMLPPYDPQTWVQAPNFARLARRATRFEKFYAGSLPCIPARRELHTGRYNFLHRSWGPLEPFDESMPQILRDAGVHSHLVSDHPHYWEDGGATYHTRYTTWDFHRGQEGDPWKAVVQSGPRGAGGHDRARVQDRINRTYMPTEAEHVQTRTVDAGLEFLETNHAADEWLLQLELFDPHEPFFTHQPYKDLYSADRDGSAPSEEGTDWPDYRKVTESPDQLEHVRREYAALVSMCDRSLGRVLDAMDEYGLWEDTMLIVNTDHGFLLGEHGWWAKTVMPWFEELVHLPFFLWDPRSPEGSQHPTAVAQTIDIAPTLLRYFGLTPPESMQGKDLGLTSAVGETGAVGAAGADGGAVPAADAGAGTLAEREGGLFGIHGGHVNVTDGRFVYMRSAATPSNAPLEQYTLMPTHMRERFPVSELAAWEPAEPFSFTQGLRTMRMETPNRWMNPWPHGTLLFDVERDPQQREPLLDDEVELRMLDLLVRLMRENDAPASQFTRLGLPVEGPVGVEHLMAGRDAERAAATAQPLPDLNGHPARTDLDRPVAEMLAEHRTRDTLAAHAPDLAQTELLTVSPVTTLIDLAASGVLPAAALTAIADDLAAIATQP